MGVPLKDYIKILGWPLIIWLKTKALFYTLGLLIWLIIFNLVEENKPEIIQSDFDKLFEESQKNESDQLVIELEYLLCIDFKD